MKVEERITEYLAVGGLFNPDMMDHDLVRDLLIDCRTEIYRLSSELEKAHSDWKKLYKELQEKG